MRWKLVRGGGHRMGVVVFAVLSIVATMIVTGAPGASALTVEYR
jgi:hypothetical protein